MRARALPRIQTDDGTTVSLSERLANLRRIYFTAPSWWPKSDRRVAIGWRPDETYLPIGDGEYAKKIERGEK